MKKRLDPRIFKVPIDKHNSVNGRFYVFVEGDGGIFCAAVICSNERMWNCAHTFNTPIIRIGIG